MFATSSIDGHLGCFHFLSIENNAALSNHGQCTQSQGKSHNLRDFTAFESDCCRQGCETSFWPNENLVQASEKSCSFSNKRQTHREMIPASPFLLLHIFYCEGKKMGIKAKKAWGKRRCNSNLYGAGLQVLMMTKVRGLALSVVRIMTDTSCPLTSALVGPVHHEDNERVQVKSLFSTTKARHTWKAPPSCYPAFQEGSSLITGSCILSYP